LGLEINEHYQLNIHVQMLHHIVDCIRRKS
jgi:hypothetical protein